MPNLMHKLVKFIFTCKRFRPLNIMKTDENELSPTD